METSLPACAPLRGISAIPAFKDNYIWLLQRGDRALVVDPGDSAPVQAVLAREGLRLEAILLTHHHADHSGGVAALAGDGVRVLGPAAESITGVGEPLRGGERLEFADLGLQLQVLAVPGHTRGHLAYYGQWEGAPVLFCGDTLFGAGCGRLFEGTPAQMAHSLGLLAALPPQTAVYCAHEYTAANLDFALAVEPGNRALAERGRKVAAMRQAGQATVPLCLAEELATNPFLRCGEAEVRASAERQAGHALTDDVAVFAALREWKNHF
ncbi:MAG: hydroxyacylglutathione hydrolase [Betaproteobacteria bacterium]|nr:MAG: hydroxyacylglutathione hydrolase [Betaproteobacteria bacterium]